jgi:hypothetical protein
VVIVRRRVSCLSLVCPISQRINAVPTSPTGLTARDLSPV